MTKPMVFNYADHERALEEIARLKEDIANLQIRCRIAESEKPVSSDRDCKNCIHQKPDGCSRWDCEYESRMVEVVRCKDCYHAEDDITHMFCVYFHYKVYEDDYCSNAVERRKDGET